MDDVIKVHDAIPLLLHELAAAEQMCSLDEWPNLQGRKVSIGKRLVDVKRRKVVDLFNGVGVHYYGVEEACLVQTIQYRSLPP